jgi:hypothetical protein
LVELNYCLNFLVQFLVPTIQSCIGWGPTFGIFGTILAMSVHFVDTYVPETTGMTLEEIEHSLQKPGSGLGKGESFESVGGIVFSESSNLLAETYCKSIENFGAILGVGNREASAEDDFLIEATLEV